MLEMRLGTKYTKSRPSVMFIFFLFMNNYNNNNIHDNVYGAVIMT